MKAEEDAALEKLKVDKADESSSKEKEVEHKSNIGQVKVSILFRIHTIKVKTYKNWSFYEKYNLWNPLFSGSCYE